MLQIAPHASGDVTVLKLTGQLIYGAESRSLAEAVKKLAASGATQVVVDLSGVGFIDSGGVGELVAGFSSIRRAGGHLKICSPTKMVREVLRIVRLTTMIPMFDSESEAVASFSNPPAETA